MSLSEKDGSSFSWQVSIFLHIFLYFRIKIKNDIYNMNKDWYTKKGKEKIKLDLGIDFKG